MKMYQPSLEDCIAACASYNVDYNANAGGDPTGLCRAVTVVKKGKLGPLSVVAVSCWPRLGMKLTDGGV
jgi:hypothetical protein